MSITFDPVKDALNIEKHGISLARVRDMAIYTIRPDRRFEYGEERFRGWGVIDGNAYCVAFTLRDDAMRVISLRRAHGKEIKRYAPA